MLLFLWLCSADLPPIYAIPMPDARQCERLIETLRTEPLLWGESRRMECRRWMADRSSGVCVYDGWAGP